MIVILRLNNGYGFILFKIEDIIGFLRFSPDNEVSLEIDTTISDFGFHRNMATIPLRQYRRSYVLQLDVFFGHIRFI